MFVHLTQNALHFATAAVKKEVRNIGLMSSASKQIHLVFHSINQLQRPKENYLPAVQERY